MFKKLIRILYLIWFEVTFAATILKILYFWWSFCVRLQEIRDSFSTADKICWEKQQHSPLRNVCQYIFPILCNTLHIKNSKYMMYNMHYRYVYLSKRVWKEITKKKIIKEKSGVKYQEKTETYSFKYCCVFQVIILDE